MANGVAADVPPDEDVEREQREREDERRPARDHAEDDERSLENRDQECEASAVETEPAAAATRLVLDDQHHASTVPGRSPWNAALQGAYDREPVRLSSTRMRWGRGTLLALVVLACALITIGFVANSRESDEDDFGPLLERVVEAGAPGVVLVVRDGARSGRTSAVSRPAVRQGRSVPATASRIGSVTKTFVAAVCSSS